MRTAATILSLILQVAKMNHNIRAVLLTGSRATNVTINDQLQDFDIIYVVTQLELFTKDHSWINVFGEKLIWQLPDEMAIGEKHLYAFHYLMLFTDGNRIDITLYPLDKISLIVQEESILKLLLDKDHLFENLSLPGEEGYLIKPPVEKEFLDCCNEFWWVSTYVAKGLWRKEISYAKAMLEDPVRTQFLQMIAWYIGLHTSFAVSFGKKGRNMQRYLSPLLYNQILATYADGAIENNWNALFRMTTLFDELANEVANALHLYYNQKEAENVVEYLKRIYAMAFW